MTLLKPGCVCGHTHETSRGEPIDLCLDCGCDGMRPRCQNCGDEATTRTYGRQQIDVCSRRCALQVELLLGPDQTRSAA